MCDRRIHNYRASRSTLTRQCVCSFFSSRTGLLATHRINQVCQSPTVHIWLFPKLKITLQMEEIFECDVHTVHKLSQRLITVDLLAPRDSDCSRMYIKVSSDWLPSYIEATRPVFEIFKMARYFPGSTRRLTKHFTHSQGKYCH